MPLCKMVKVIRSLRLSNKDCGSLNERKFLIKSALVF